MALPNGLDRAARAAAALPRRQPLVLMYHAFGPSPPGGDPYDLFLPTENLERQLDLLLRNGWRPVDLDEWVSTRDRGSGGTGRFHVTIDDGFVSVVDEAAHVLAARGVPATVFVLAGLLGETSRWLADLPDARLASAEQVAALTRNGFAVGVHGHDHRSLTDVDEDALLLNTDTARRTIAEVTGTEPRGFAYPFGWHDTRARAAVAAAGFDVAFSLYDDAGPFAVSRVDVKPSDAMTTFCAKLIPGYRRAWRTAGRVRPVRRTLRRLTDRLGR